MPPAVKRAAVVVTGDAEAQRMTGRLPEPTGEEQAQLP